MPSAREQFFAQEMLAIVGNSDLGPFPGQLYAELRGLVREVYPVDLGGSRYVQGDEAFASLADLPVTRVDGVIISLPRHKAPDVVDEMVQLGIKQLWLQGGHTPELQQICDQNGITIHSGNARVYTRPGFSLGRTLLKLIGRY